MTKNKLISLLLSIAMILSLTGVVYAVEDSVSYIDAAGETEYCTDYGIMGSFAGDNYTFSGEGDEWVYVISDMTIPGKLELLNTNLNIILGNDITLTIEKGIVADENSKLTIYARTFGDEAGKLIIKDNKNYNSLFFIDALGIDSENDVIINGGDINITASTENAIFQYSWGTSQTEINLIGISANNLKINGGKLTVETKDISADFKGGYSNSIYVSENIDINGGNIKLTAGNVNSKYDGMGYGSYGMYAGGNIDISGGNVDIRHGSADEVTRIYTRGILKISNDAKIKELFINKFVKSVELSGGYFKELYITPDKDFEEIVAAGYGFVDENGDEVEIDGRKHLSNVKVAEGDFPYSLTSGGAEVTTVDGKKIYVGDEKYLLKYLMSEKTIKIKLLEDFYINVYYYLREEYGCYNVQINSKKLTLDLNGCTLEISGDDETEGALIFYEDFTLEDTSKKQQGKFIIDSAYSYHNEIFDSGFQNVVMPRITISGGEFNVIRGVFYGTDVTVSGGTLKSDYNAGGCIGIEYLGSFNVSGGTVDARVLVKNSKINITGGKIKGDEESFNNVNPFALILKGENEVSLTSGTISGGEIDVLCYNDNTSLKIKGGSFKSIKSLELRPAIMLLEPGYAFHSLDKTTQNEMVVNARNDELEDVYVKEHTCVAGEDDAACECGRAVQADLSVPEDAVLKCVFTNGRGDTYTKYAKSLFEDRNSPYDVLSSITLLKDYRNETNNSMHDMIGSNLNLTIDLNGHTLEWGCERNEGYEYQPFRFGENNNITIKDSSKDKKGVLVVSNLMVMRTGKLILESGMINASNLNESNLNESNLISGEVEVKGGTLKFGNYMSVMNGRLSVSDGLLQGRFIITYKLTDSNQYSDGKSEVPDAADTGDTILITGGKVWSNISVSEHTSLRVTGGEVGKINEEDNNSGIWNEKGEVYISGGKIALLRNNPDGLHTTKLSGGTFDYIYYEGAELSELLEENYAYYKKNGNEYNTVAVPLTIEESEKQDVEYFEDVMVKAHSCEFDANGKCGCGKTGNANTKAVFYIDDKGNEAYCNSYSLLTSEKNNLEDGWYVVDGNVTINGGLNVGGNINIILKDGCNLTVNDGITGDEKNISIYAQSLGAAAGKLNIKSKQTEGYGLYANDLTINGGNITVNSKEMPENKTSVQSIGVAVENLVMNNGILTTYGEDVTTKESSTISCGIQAYGMIMNGGTVNAYGGNTTAILEETDNSGYSVSIGIAAMRSLKINGGSIYAEGGNVTVKGNRNPDIDYQAMSIGINGDEFATDDSYNNGTITAVSGKAEVIRPEDSSIGNGDITESYGIYSGFLRIKGGNVNAYSSDAKEAKKSYSSALSAVYELLISGGNVNLSHGEAYDAYDIISKGTSNFNGGAVKSTRNGGAVMMLNDRDDTEIRNCAIKFETSFFKKLIAYSSLNSFCAYGYATCQKTQDDKYSYLYTNTEAENVYIKRAVYEVKVNVNDTENGTAFDLKQFRKDLTNAPTYRVSVDADDNLTAVVNNDVLTIKATETAEIGNFKVFEVYINEGMSTEVIIIKVQFIGKEIPKIALTKDKFEKTYDGEAISIDAVRSDATVTDADGNSVLGSWSWYSQNIPKDAGEYNLTANFSTGGDEFGEAFVTVKVIINPKTLEGEPIYKKLNQKGETLADTEIKPNTEWPNGTAKWVDENGNAIDSDMVVEAGRSYRWEFVPEDSVNYKKLNGEAVIMALTPIIYDDDDTPVEGPKKDNKTEEKPLTPTNPKKEDTGKIEVKPLLFKDVHGTGHWAEKAIDFMTEKGLMNGMSDEKFEPEAKLTRGMLVTILYRLAGEPEVEGESGFDDISGDEYYAKAVTWARQNRIVNGITSKTFGANDNITREQIVTIIYRFAQYMGYDVVIDEDDIDMDAFEDADDIEEYAYQAIRFAIVKGIVNGRTKSTINPKDDATRAEIATIVQRFELIQNN